MPRAAMTASGEASFGGSIRNLGGDVGQRDGPIIMGQRERWNGDNAEHKRMGDVDMQFSHGFVSSTRAK
jgi:hypothetical protein